MGRIKRNYFFDERELMIYKNFQVVIAEQIKIDFIVVIANSHYERALLVKQADLIIQCQLLKFSASDHILNIAQKYLGHNLDRSQVFL
jgi:hypothetical protein